MSKLAHDFTERAWSFLEQTQQDNGCWLALPEARVFETGLTVLVLRHAQLLPDAVARGTAWLLQHGAVQTHHPIAQCIDAWLLQSAHGALATLDVTHPAFDEPAFVQRKRVFSVLAQAVGAPVVGAVDPTAMAAALKKKLGEPNKVWSGAEIAALALLLPHDDETRGHAVRMIERAQFADGSIAANPVSTVIALLALSRAAPASEAFARAQTYLRTTQLADGTWRFASAEVWDTSLLLRAFHSFSDRPAFARAVDFVMANQNDDGGFPYRPHVESDTDTTGMTLMAVRSRRQLSAAVDYLRARRQGNVWQTWNAAGDPPAEDAIAHAILGLRAHNCSAAELVGPETWLASRVREGVGWTADWYNITSYACHEVALAIGRRARGVRYAADQLLSRQNADGGFGPSPHADSTPAATSLAMGLLSHYLANDDDRLARAMAYLCAAQNPDGSIGGATDMYAPRPFAIDYRYQSHALAVIGPMALRMKAERPRVERRQRQRAPQPYVAVPWDEVSLSSMSGEGVAVADGE